MVETRSTTQRLKKTTRHIPTYIISDIFLECSVKTLTVFKCVSKNWCKMIEDPTFIKRHFKHSRKHNKSSTFIIQAFYRMPWVEYNTKFYSFGNGSSKSEPPRGKSNLLNIVSCDGLICFLTRSNKIHVWNPATKESVQLPKPKDLPQSYLKKTIMLGLGFDSCMKQYKVVCWNLFQKDVQIMTIGAESWRNMECPYPYPSPYERRENRTYGACVCFPVYVNGTSHWYYDGKIVSFNFCEEKFGILSLPKDRKGESSKIFEVSGCLCLVVKESIDVVVRMWVLENYDKQEWVCKKVILPSFEMHNTFVMLVREGEILIETRVDSVGRRYLCAYNEEGYVINFSRIKAMKDGCSDPCQYYTESLTRIRCY